MVDLAAQLVELREFHKQLKKAEKKNHEVIVSGSLQFEAMYDGLMPITDSFEIEMLIPGIYPNILPQVRETGHKISSSYEHVFSDGTLCLAVPIEKRRIFSLQPSLLGFVNKLVIPYFYGYCYWEKFSVHPFGEQKHGGEGIAQYYVDKLNLSDEVTALTFVCYLYEHGYRGHHDCPCGSGRIARKCHGPILLDLHQYHTPLTLRHDLISVLTYSLNKLENGKLSLPDALKKQIYRILKRTKH